MLQAIYTLYVWTVFVPVMLTATVIFGAVCLVLAPLLGPRRTARITAVPWARLGLALAGIRLRVEGIEQIEPGRSYVVVANHLSHLDIWVLYGYLGLDLRWVMKQELRHVPVIGICSATLGHVFIDRSDHEKAMASLEDARRRIVDGTSILFFPEGTRSRNGRLRDFKKGAFRMARDLNLPVLPVTLVGTRELLRPGSALLRPGRAALRIHPPLEVTGRDTDELRRASRNRVASGLEDPEAVAPSDH